MKFSETHEWVRVDGNTAVVGVTNHAQEELGEIVFVECPEVGGTVNAHSAAAVLESTKAAADVYSPVTGTVTEVNAELQDSPELVNGSAEEKGWLYKVQLSKPEELEALMDKAQYDGFITNA